MHPKCNINHSLLGILWLYLPARDVGIGIEIQAAAQKAIGVHVLLWFWVAHIVHSTLGLIHVYSQGPLSPQRPR